MDSKYNMNASPMASFIPAMQFITRLVPQEIPSNTKRLVTAKNRQKNRPESALILKLNNIPREDYSRIAHYSPDHLNSEALIGFFSSVFSSFTVYALASNAQRVMIESIQYGIAIFSQ